MPARQNKAFKIFEQHDTEEQQPFCSVFKEFIFSRKIFDVISKSLICPPAAILTSRAPEAANSAAADPGSAVTNIAIHLGLNRLQPELLHLVFHQQLLLLVLVALTANTARSAHAQQYAFSPEHVIDEIHQIHFVGWNAFRTCANM